MLVYQASQRSIMAYDFRERSPQGSSKEMFVDEKGRAKPYKRGNVEIAQASMNGHLAVGVPGLVAGLVQAHKKHGRLPLAQIIQPAIALAEKGFPVYPRLASAIKERADVLRQFPASAKIFVPHGHPLPAGALLVQQDLGWTLRQIARDGERSFYHGEVARRLIAEMERGGGLITRQDLASYRVKPRNPLRGSFHQHQIVTMPPPSSGGIHLIEILNMLTATGYTSTPPGSAASYHLLAETMRRAFADRAQYLGDPDFVKIPLQMLASESYARRLAQTIDKGRATPSREIHSKLAAKVESPSTTHISVVDRAGNAVSTTQTINYTFGSCVVAEGTGIVLNDEMDDFSITPSIPNAFGLITGKANEIAPGKTMLSSMSPTLVFDREGKLRLIVGSPGGPRIISATLQAILNVLAYEMPLADAVHAARIHHQWVPDVLYYEPQGLSPEVIEALTAKGHRLKEMALIGDVQAIAREPMGYSGVSDVRSDGAPAGLF
jgi:gamma-glutamyltranspeptidase/glutathione hydrolase